MASPNSRSETPYLLSERLRLTPTSVLVDVLPPSSTLASPKSATLTVPFSSKSTRSQDRMIARKKQTIREFISSFTSAILSLELVRALEIVNNRLTVLWLQVAVQQRPLSVIRMMAVMQCEQDLTEDGMRQVQRKRLTVRRIDTDKSVRLCRRV